MLCSISYNFPQSSNKRMVEFSQITIHPPHLNRWHELQLKRLDEILTLCQPFHIDVIRDLRSILKCGCPICTVWRVSSINEMTAEVIKKKQSLFFQVLFSGCVGLLWISASINCGLIPDFAAMKVWVTCLRSWALDTSITLFSDRAGYIIWPMSNQFQPQPWLWTITYDLILSICVYSKDKD